MTDQELVARAAAMRSRAVAPYSHYQVGAALLGSNGKVYGGCNIENGSYGATNCAERTAFFKAVYDGERAFTAIAVCGGKDGVIADVFPPCGICRQVMREFCEDDFKVYLVGKDGVYTERTLVELLPDSFRPKTHMQG